MYTTPPTRVCSFERRHCSVCSDEGVQFTTAEVFNLTAVFTVLILSIFSSNLTCFLCGLVILPLYRSHSKRTSSLFCIFFSAIGIRWNSCKIENAPKDYSSGALVTRSCFSTFPDLAAFHQLKNTESGCHSSRVSSLLQRSQIRSRSSYVERYAPFRKGLFKMDVHSLELGHAKFLEEPIHPFSSEVPSA